MLALSVAPSSLPSLPVAFFTYTSFIFVLTHMVVDFSRKGLDLTSCYYWVTCLSLLFFGSLFSICLPFGVGMMIIVYSISGFHIPCSSTFPGKYSGDDRLSVDPI